MIKALFLAVFLFGLACPNYCMNTSGECRIDVPPPSQSEISESYGEEPSTSASNSANDKGILEILNRAKSFVRESSYSESFLLPEPINAHFGGKAKTGKSSKNNQFSKTIFNYIKGKVETPPLIPREGCELSFSLDEDACLLAYLFDRGMKVLEEEVEKLIPADKKSPKTSEKKKKRPESKSEIDLELGNKPKKKDEEEKPVVQLGTHTLLLVIKDGMKIFGENARLDWSRLPIYKWKPSKGKLQKMLGLIPDFIVHICNVAKRANDHPKRSKEPDLEKGTTELSGEPQTELFATEIAEILKGDEEEKQKGQALQQRLKVEVDKIRKDTLNPIELLDSVRYKIRPVGEDQNCIALAELTQNALYDGDNDASKDFRVRLGAQALNSIINARSFTKETGIAFAGSVFFTIGIAVFLDGYLWPLLVQQLANFFKGHKNIAVVVFTFLLNAITALIAETLDSALISRFLNFLKGEDFLPKTFEKYKEDLREATQSGTVAMFGNMFSQATDLLESIRKKPFSITELEELKHQAPNKIGKKLIPFIPMLIISLVTNQIAASTSAAVVPKNMEKTRQYLMAELHNRYRNGFFTFPKDELHTMKSNQLGTGQENAAAERVWLHNYIKETVSMSMKVNQASATAINSMGVGSFISFSGILTMDVLSEMNNWPQKIMKIATIALNGPTEMISMAFISFSSNHMGASWMQNFLSTDKNKNQQIMEKIIEKSQYYGKAKSVQQGRHKIKSTNDYSISLEELNKIYIPRFNLSFGYGEAIIKAMNKITPSNWKAKKLVDNSLLDKIWGKPEEFDQVVENIGRENVGEFSNALEKLQKKDDLQGA